MILVRKPFRACFIQLELFVNWSRNNAFGLIFFFLIAQQQLIRVSPLLRACSKLVLSDRLPPPSLSRRLLHLALWDRTLYKVKYEILVQKNHKILTWQCVSSIAFLLWNF